MTITLIRADGTEIDKTAEAPKKPDVEWYCKAAEIEPGYMELVRFPMTDENGRRHRAMMVVHESGHLHGLPMNTKATALYWQNPAFGNVPVHKRAVIVGPALVFTPPHKVD